jgi:hypothetical protein
MGFVDRLRTYLNEEDENKPSSEVGTADNRVHLQHIEQVEKDGVSVSFSAEGTKAAAKNSKKQGKKHSEKKQSTTKQNVKKQTADTKNESRTGEKKADRASTQQKSAAVSGKSGQTQVGDRITDSNRTNQLRDVKLFDETEDEAAPKESRRERRKHKKAVKKLAKTIRKNKSAISEGTKYGKLSGNEKIRSESSDIDRLIFRKATYEEAERQTVTDFCEQLVDVSYHMEDMEREYRTVTGYLEDIQRIEELPDEYRLQIADIASRIIQLGDDKNRYMQSENLLSQEQYALLAQLEKEVPGTIKKLYDMEERDSMLKNDMGYLEGEKADLKFMRGEYTDAISRIRGIMSVLLVLGFVTLGVIAAVAMVGKATVTVYVLAVMAFVVLVFAVGYVRYLTVAEEVRMNDARLTKAVSLLNKVKVKYINNTNTMEYIYDKYGVNSSNELEYSWQMYNTMVQDMLRYSETNKDIRRLNEELLHNLRRYGIHEPEIWMSQVRALADPREMVEVKHSLNQSRQKIRENLRLSERIRSNAITALRASVAENPGMAELIQDILAPYHLTIL